MTDDNDSGRLLLGARGWPHPEWRGGYFPEDLPEDWEFAYYSNEAGCLLLPAQDWLALGQAQLEEWLDECEPWFRFFLESPPGRFPVERLSWFGDRLGGVLIDESPCELPAYVPLWRRAADAGRWVERHSHASLLCWDIAGEDLRSLRARLEDLPPATGAVVLEGGAEVPAQLADLRTLTELMGIA